MLLDPEFAYSLLHLSLDKTLDNFVVVALGFLPLDSV